ncbi:MAG: double-cubane-cluster-containing anaerobic reductase [Andreesenia angusta]|nr:double-cubane-cluster-containing anaerobic reductase [Andreesenia angusta]
MINLNYSLPKAFQEFDDAKKENFIKMKDLKEKGKNVVGTYCTYSPTEIIKAAKAIPVGLCAMSDESIEDAEKHLPRNLCPLIKSSYGYALTDSCPYFYFSDLILGETTCDGKKKMYELMNEVKPVHLMQLPQTTEGQMSFDLWKSEIIKFKERLEEEFDIRISDEDLKKAIKDRNKERKALKSVYELGKMVPPPFTGENLLSVLYGTTFKFTTEEIIDSLSELRENALKEYENGNRPVSEDKPRILITGCPMAGATMKIVKLIEENGGTVVCFENCTGLKAIEELVNEDIDAYDALAEKYLNIPCSVMTPNEDRFKLLQRLIKEYNIDGVVEMVLQACHTYAIESYNTKNAVNLVNDTPFISVETDYSQSDIGQLKTRLTAFLEML